MSTSSHCSLLPDYGHNMISYLISLPPDAPCPIKPQVTTNLPSGSFSSHFVPTVRKTMNALSNSSSFRSNCWVVLHRWQNMAHWQVPWNITMITIHPTCVHIPHMWVCVRIHGTMLLCRHNLAAYAGPGHFQPEIQTLVSTLTYLVLFSTPEGLDLACLVSSSL